ncbi:hypothetical protein PENTCL1PPCAC_1697, partial [Pristionchus entomophagus]
SVMDHRRPSIHNVNEWMKKADDLLARITILVARNDPKNTTNCYPQHDNEVRKGVIELGYADVEHFCESFLSKFIIDRGTGLIILHRGETSNHVEQKEVKDTENKDEPQPVRLTDRKKRVVRVVEESFTDLNSYSIAPSSMTSSAMMDQSISKKVESIHFKFSHEGKTRRFAIPRDYSYLIGSIKNRVQQIIGQKDTILYWRDDDSLIVLECGEDVQAAIDFAESQNKPPTCILLEATIEKKDENQNDEENKENREIVNPRLSSRDDSRAAFNDFVFMCDECECFLAPSTGGRFKCIICDNYDLCAACVAKGVHDNHALVRLLNGETIVPMADGKGGINNVQLMDTPRCTPSFIAQIIDKPSKPVEFNKLLGDLLFVQRKDYGTTVEEQEKNVKENREREHAKWEEEKKKWMMEIQQLDVMKTLWEEEKAKWKKETENWEKLNANRVKEYADWEETKNEWERWQRENEDTLNERLNREELIRMEEEDRKAWEAIDEEKAERGRTEAEKEKRRLEIVLNEEREEMRRIDEDKEEKSRLGEKKKRIEGVCEALMRRVEETTETHVYEEIESQANQENLKENNLVENKQEGMTIDYSLFTPIEESEDEEGENQSMFDFSFEDEINVAEMEKEVEEERKKEDELKEILKPWNNDTAITLVKDQGRIIKLDENKPEIERVKDEEETMNKFFENHEEELKTLSRIKAFDKTEEYLLEHPLLASECTVAWNRIEALTLAIEDRDDKAMCVVAEQAVLLQYLLEMAKSLQAEPTNTDTIKTVFKRFRESDSSYLRIFHDEVLLLQYRLRHRAKQIPADVSDLDYESHIDEEQLRSRLATCVNGLWEPREEEREGSSDGFDMMHDDDSGLETASAEAEAGSESAAVACSPATPVGDAIDDNVEISWPSDRSSDGSDIEIIDRLDEESETVLETMHVLESKFDQLMLQPICRQFAVPAAPAAVAAAAVDAASLPAAGTTSAAPPALPLSLPAAAAVAPSEPSAPLLDAAPVSAAPLAPVQPGATADKSLASVLDALLGFENTDEMEAWLEDPNHSLSTNAKEEEWPGEGWREAEEEADLKSVLHNYRMDFVANSGEVANIPAFMEYNILVELHDMQNIDEILLRLEQYCKHVSQNSKMRKEHSTIFSDNKDIENEMVNRVAIDLDRRLKSMRKIVQNALLYRKGMIWNRICELKVQIHGFTYNRRWLESVSIDLKYILLTDKYTINPIEKVERGFKLAVGQAKSFVDHAKEASSLMRWMAPASSQNQKGDAKPMIDDLLFSDDPSTSTALRAAVFSPPPVNLPFRQLSRQQQLLSELFQTGIFEDHERMVEVCRTAMNLEQAIEMMLDE